MRNEKGISLIEVLVSMVIIAIGLLGLAPLVVLSIDANSMSQDAMAACTLAKEKIETYENASLLPALPYSEQETDLEGGYNRATRIWDNTVDTLLPADLCQVEVVISWQDKMGVSRSATYSTLLDTD
jgi:prepilin-type N-terminal cleavage/methylation domain-containing protein